MRRVYRVLLFLHPAAFRRRFGAEMLCSFDEARTFLAIAWLLADALRSIARQWIVRERLWIHLAAAVGGMLTL